MSVFKSQKCKEWGENEEFVSNDYEFELPARCLICISNRSGTQEKIWSRETDLGVLFLDT